MLLRRLFQRQIQSELEARRKFSVDVKPWDPAPLLFEGQRSAVFDPARFQSWPGGRQGGKTDAAEKLLLRVARFNAGQQAIYASTSIKRAVATIWDELVEFNRAPGLGGRVNHGAHTIAFPGAGKLVVTGVEDKRMADDIRGRKKVRLYIIDEAQDWPDELLRYFFERVVYPSLVAVRGNVVITGTGGAPRGFWYECAEVDESFSKHRFSPLTNPFLAKGEAQMLIDKACKDRGVTVEDAGIQREFFGRFVAETEKQIFPYNDELNGYDELPKDVRFSKVVGADFGTVDACGTASWMYSDQSPHIYLHDVDEQTGLSSSGQVAMVKAAEVDGWAVAIVGDPGGGGKDLITDLRQEHWMHIDAAEKQGKAAACITMRSGLRSGKIKIRRGQSWSKKFVEYLTSVEWDPERIGDVIRGHMPDAVDAALYGYRKVVTLHHYSPPKQKPTKSPLQIELEKGF